MIRIAAIILMTLTAGAGAAQATDMPYVAHKACNKGWTASKAYTDQGCRSYRINADSHDPNGAVLCFYDVYCDRGEWWQRASRKGDELRPYQLGDLRRCANNPRKLVVGSCEPITDEQLQADADQYN